MYKPYATEKQICETIAAYKIGDLVTLLTNQHTDNGVIEAGTTMRIVSVEIFNSDIVHIDKVFKDDLNDYTTNNDNCVFIYKLVPTDHAEALTIECFSHEIEKGEIPSDIITFLRKQKRKCLWKTLVLFVVHHSLVFLITIALFYIAALILVLLFDSSINAVGPCGIIFLAGVCHFTINTRLVPLGYLKRKKGRKYVEEDNNV